MQGAYVVPTGRAAAIERSKESRSTIRANEVEARSVPTRSDQKSCQ